VALYGGETSARAFLAEEFTAMRRSPLASMQVLRAEADWLWARLCLLEAMSLPHQRGSALREVRKMVDQLESEQVPYASALALLVRGCHDSVVGERSSAMRHLTSARIALQGHLGLCAAAAEYRLGQVGNDSRRQEGEAMLRALGARDPERMVDVLAPGAFAAR
jgi:hypothetical protein